MQRYFNVLSILLAALAVALALPAAAAAGCPGCEEYTLDIPEDDGGGNPTAPAPAPTAPAPAAPTAPVTPTTTVPGTTVPTAPVPVAPVEAAAPKPKPVDTDPDPVPDSAKVKPVEVENLPAIAASQAEPLQPAGSGASGLLPLAIAMGAIAFVAGAIGFRRRGADQDASETARR